MNILLPSPSKHYVTYYITQCDNKEQEKRKNEKDSCTGMTAGMLLCSMATTISAAPDKGSYGEVPLYRVVSP